MRCVAVVVAALALASPAFASGNLTNGKTLFKSKCGTCHALVAAATTGKSDNHGPALTNMNESARRVLSKLEGATLGLMPQYVGVLSSQQINDVVAFVVAASKTGVKTVK